MKCRECPDYVKCVKESNLAIKRKNCPKARAEKVKTNADRIRSMTDEELSKEYWCPYSTGPDFCYINSTCTDCRLHWLQQPAEVE